ncbi:MAG: two-component regulator propeller domain-containing protein [Flavobacteriales bacterium]
MTLTRAVKMLLLVFIGLSLPGWSNYATHYYTVSNGLSSNTINAIYQDKSGLIWIGTDDGLNVFDGYTFRVFRNEPGNSKSIHHNKIIYIREDSKGNLWVGTSTALSKYNAADNTFLNFFINKSDKGYALMPHNKDQNKFSMFEMDDKDQLWTSVGNGLMMINPSRNEVKTFEQPANSGKIVNHILKVSDNEILIGSSDEGLDILNLSTKKIKHLHSLHQSNISFMAKGDNKIWIGSYGKGPGILDILNDQFQSLVIEDYVSQKYRLNNILCGLHSSNKEIYLGNESGLFLYNATSKNFTLATDNTFFSSKSLVHYGSRYIMEDKQGNLWIGTYREGLIYIQKNASGFNVLKDMQPSSNLNLGYVNAIIQDGKNILIASGERGLISFDPDSKNFSCYNIGEAPYKLQSRELCYLFKHSSGTLWMGSANAGVCMYDPATKKSKILTFAPPDKNYNSGNQTMAILEDNDKNIWIATEGDGVKIINPKDFSVKHLHHDPQDKNSIASNWVRSLLKDQHGNIWIGTVWGLSKWNKKENKIFNFLADESSSQKLQDNTITHIVEDKKGTIWLATAKGLHQLKPNGPEEKYTFRNFSSRDGLNNNTIHAIAEDHNGNIWVTTNGGISLLNTKTNAIINYPFSDLPINFFCEKSVCVTASGMVMFGGINKLIYFDPNQLQSTNNKLEAQISELRLFNELVLPGDTINDRILLSSSINSTQELELNYEENVLSFLLSAIYYEDPNGLEYSYMLEGFNNEWLHTSASNRLVTYTHLAPGSYTFRVKVKNRNGIETGKEKTLTITILPPWWRSNLAYLFYTALFIFLLWLYRHVTLKQLQLKQEVELQKAAVEKQEELISAKMEFYTNVSHEFKTPLTLIQGPIDKLIREDKDAERQNMYGLMKQNTLRLKKYIDEILLFRKIQTQNQELKISHQDFLLFIQPIADSFRFQAQTRNITFENTSNSKSIYAWFDEEKMEKVLMNLLSNAVKYTPDNGKVTLTINSINGDENIRITVSDTGPGIPENEKEKIFDEFYQSKINPNIEGIGIGLSLVKGLISLHKGTIDVESEKGKGCTFSVVIPISKEAYKDNEISEKRISVVNETIAMPQSTTKSIAAKTNYKILIVDDNNDIRSFLKDELKNIYNILEAENGKAALELLANERPDLIISDVMMPEMDGFELCKSIKTHEELSAVPVILLTAKTSEESMISGLEFGADDYISKPFNMDILQIKIRNILQQIEKIKQMWKNLGPVTNTENAPINMGNEFVSKLIAGIETHMENVDLSPAILAQTVGISRTKLYSMVAEHTGHSVIDFIYIIRLRKAAELLSTGKFNVSEVSWKVGFKQHSHFTKRFTEHFGKSPSSLIP